MRTTETLTATSDRIADNCPRCDAELVGAEFYGPCAACRVELRNDFKREKGAVGNCETAKPLARRWRKIEPPRRVFIEATEGEPDLTDLPTWAGATVHVAGASSTDWVSAAALTVPPDGWSTKSSYLHGAPVVRFGDDSGASVTIADAAMWGAEGLTAGESAEAWRAGVGAIREAATGLGSWHPIGTPATAGRDLLLRMLPEGSEFPPAPVEVCDLLRSTTGQGRAEMFGAGREVDEFHELDMRTAYGAVAWGLVTGVPAWHRGAPPAAWNGGRLAGRYLVRWSAPDDWGDRPGILPERGDDGPHWPMVGEGWADGAEVDLAVKWGWRVEIVEGFTWCDGPAGDPLRRWAETLTRAAMACERAGNVGQLSRSVARAARGIPRSMLVAAVGALWGGTHRVTRTMPLSDITSESGPPADANVSIRGDVATWSETVPAAWPELVRPEWAAQIWARCRCRLLDAPTGTRGVRAGALHLPPDALVGFRTDCIYVTGAPPIWPDDGAAGRYRLKRSTGAGVVPQSVTGMDAMFRRASAPAADSIESARSALRGGVS